MKRTIPSNSGDGSDSAGSLLAAPLVLDAISGQKRRAPSDARTIEGSKPSRRAASVQPTRSRLECIEWDVQVVGLGKRIRKNRTDWIIQGRRNGETVKRTIGNARIIDVATARMVARDLLRDPADSRATPPLFETFAENFLRDTEHRWKDSTRTNVVKLVRRRLVPIFQGKRIDAISRADVLLWFEGCKSSRNWCLSVMSSLMYHAEDLGFRPVRANPCVKLRRKRSDFAARYPSRDDYCRLGEALRQEHSRNPSAVMAIRFLALTGARKGEALSLCCEHLHGDRAALPDSKTGRKTVWLPGAVQRLLAAEANRCGQTPYVFGSPDRRKAVREIDRTWDAVRGAAGVPHLRLHDLRHGFASVAVRKNLDLHTISRLLSHADLSTTRGYAHLEDDQVASAANRVASRMAEALSISAVEARIAESTCEPGASRWRNPAPPASSEAPVPVLGRAMQDFLRGRRGANGELPSDFCKARGIDFEVFKGALRERRHRRSISVKSTTGQIR